MIIFRTDANSEIASGHVARCLSLADAFRDAGECVAFLVSDESASGAIASRGYSVKVLGTDWRDLTGEIPAVKEILSGGEAMPLYIIDTYSVCEQYVDELSDVALVCYLGSKGGRLGRLDALINYSVEADGSSYRKWYGEGTSLLLGPKFAPLRSEFQGRARIRRGDASRLLLTTGGTDRNGVMQSLIAALDEAGVLARCTADVVIGPMFASRESLMDAYADDPRVMLHEGVSSMANLMDVADIAISANGTTVYELAAMGVPSVTFALSPEQVSSGLAFGGIGAVAYCGEMFANRGPCAKAVATTALRLMGNLSERSAMAEKAHDIVDGAGCRRIVRRLLEIRECKESGR